jgi:putative transposase
MPRGPRLDAPGTLHHVIVRGIEQGSIVRDDTDRSEFLKRMGTLANVSGTSIYAFALMTNHLHILLKSGPSGLSTYMRRLLSSYAPYFNRRHKRVGHLFQNRYKSIICEEDPYLLELVRYIHLNPLRVGAVKDMSALKTYPWSGHGALMGSRTLPGQNLDEVLGYFGKRMSTARKNCLTCRICGRLLAPADFQVCDIRLISLLQGS